MGVSVGRTATGCRLLQQGSQTENQHQRHKRTHAVGHTTHHLYRRGADVVAKREQRKQQQCNHGPAQSLRRLIRGLRREWLVCPRAIITGRRRRVELLRVVGQDRRVERVLHEDGVASGDVVLLPVFFRRCVVVGLVSRCGTRRLANNDRELR